MLSFGRKMVGNQQQGVGVPSEGKKQAKGKKRSKEDILGHTGVTTACGKDRLTKNYCVGVYCAGGDLSKESDRRD